MHCKICNKELSAYQKEYCSKSCGNKGRRRHGREPGVCIVCGEKKESHRQKFCSHKCHNVVKEKEIQNKITLGLISERGTLKKYLKQIHHNGCFICGLFEWHGKKLPLELDHIDGNATNNFPSNLRILCPNCHSITETWKAKNKGNGRKSKGIKLS